jgi:hypothetical protein
MRARFRDYFVLRGARVCAEPCSVVKQAAVAVVASRWELPAICRRRPVKEFSAASFRVDVSIFVETSRRSTSRLEELSAPFSGRQVTLEFSE